MVQRKTAGLLSLLFLSSFALELKPLVSSVPE